MTMQQCLAPGAAARVVSPAPEPDAEEARAFAPVALARIAVVAVAAVLVWFEVYEPVEAVSVIGLAGLAIGGWPMFREALANLLARRMTMELSMSIAVLAAASISELFTALVILVFVLVAEELERLTISRGRRAIQDLMDFVPREVRVRRGGAIATVPAAEVRVGDTVAVNPGEAIPVDGTVTSGHSHVDQSRITGESMPAYKEAGEPVFAGSINQAGALEILVERVGRDTSYGRIIEAVETAGRARAPVQRMADRLAGYLVYFAFAAAGLTYLITRDIHDTISVVIVAGACGIAAGTPLAILGGIGRAARRGAVIKGGLHLENLGRIDTVVLDKTGTLTFGEPAVRTVKSASGFDPDAVLRLAAAAERTSEHPLAKAVAGEAAARDLAVPEATDFSYQIGRGIAATVEGRTVLVGNARLLQGAGVALPAIEADDGSSHILVAVDGVFAGQVLVADRLRPESQGALAELRDMGIRTVLLTGDVAPVARAIGAELGIGEVEAELLPEDKLARVSALVDAGRVVAMVGDGVNDAPALTRATVGVAMGSGTDVAKESADVMLIGNDLAKFVETIRIARHTRTIIWQNFAGTLGVDALGMALAAAGLLNPLLAAFIHVSSELVFLLNSARLMRRGGSPP